MAQNLPAGTGADNLAWAAHLVDALVGAGVTRAVISPGSRSTPLTLAWLRHPAARTFVQVDERCAAFFALGLALAGGGPVALVATSGSAPTHWWPAVIEADRAAVPLLLLSADRPLDLQDCGANQTVDQVKLFGGHVRAFHQTGEADCRPERLHWLGWLAHRAADQSRFPVPGPVHLNIAFREPLLPDEPPPAFVRTAPPGPRISRGILAPDPGVVDEVAAQLSGRPGVIVCGPLHGGSPAAPAILELARRLDAPIFADPLSGLRYGPHDRTRVLACYDAFLRRPAAVPGPEWVMRFGAAPVSKALNQWLEHLQGVQVLVAQHGRWLDPMKRASWVVHSDPERFADALSVRGPASAPAGWFTALEALEQRAAAAAAALRRNGDALFEGDVLPGLLEALPAGSRLFAGNSMVIRDLDSFSGTAPKKLQFLGSRGTSGIDGNVSTVFGLAAGGEGPVAGVIGDLALLHDLGGLRGASGLGVLLMVINNGGGAIFGYLPQAALPEFERGWLTPSGLDIGGAAALFGLRHRRAETGPQLTAALEELVPAEGVRVLEVVLDREASVRRHRDYWAAAIR